MLTLSELINIDYQHPPVKMPRKRNLVLGFFRRSRNASPSPTVQQASSNVGSTTSLVLAHEGATGAPSIPSAHSQLSQAGSSGVVLPVPQVTSSITPSWNPSTQPTESSAKEVASIAWEGVKMALILLKESSDWLPQLKVATGGFLALINAIEVRWTNILLSLSNLASCHPAMQQILKFFVKRLMVWLQS